MLPIRHRSIFRSRWIALLWAGGILWSAVEFAGGQSHQDGPGNTAGSEVLSNEDAAAVQTALHALNAMK